MILKVFENKTGIIYGEDPKRIESSKSGVLQMGQTEIEITARESVIMPNLFYGATGCYDATFTDEDGSVYLIQEVAVRGGWIIPPDKTALEIMELRCKADSLSKKCAQLSAQIEELSKIFDTDALNFLIK